MKRIAAIAAAGVLGLVCSVKAANYTYEAVLAPVAGTTGSAGASGLVTGTYDDASNLLTWNIVYSGMSSTVTNSHFHRLSNGSVAQGTGVGASPIIGQATLSPALESEFLAESWYLNVHTDTNRAGEIAGTINVVPEPGTLSLAATGAMLLLRRRTRRN